MTAVLLLFTLEDLGVNLLGFRKIWAPYGENARFTKTCERACEGVRRGKNKKRAASKSRGHEVWRSITSRGEQLLRRNWEVTVMCNQLKTLFPNFDQLEKFTVQYSYAAAALVSVGQILASWARFSRSFSRFSLRVVCEGEKAPPSRER